MKWLFAYDHKFFEENNEFYSKQGFPYEMWQRYLEHCDELVVTGRVSKLSEDRNKYSLSSGNSVTFINIPDASNISFFLPLNPAKSALLKEIKKVDAVIARIPSQNGFLSIEIARKLNKPYAIEIVGDPKEGYRFYGNWKAKLYGPLATMIMKQAVKSSYCSIYITEKELQKIYPTDGLETVCSNVDLISYASHTEIEARKKNFLSQQLIFGMIGSLDSDYKGLDIAIEALASIKESLPNFEFRVLGSGPTMKWEKLAAKYGLSNNIIFCGTQPSDKVSEWLKEIDIYLQPSRTEGQGRSVIEAMAMGCPVVTSNVGGMKELAEEKMRFPNGDAQACAEIITRLIENNALYQQQIERNYRTSFQFSKERLEEIRKHHYQTFKKRMVKN